MPSGRGLLEGRPRDIKRRHKIVICGCWKDATTGEVNYFSASDLTLRSRAIERRIAERGSVP